MLTRNVLQVFAKVRLRAPRRSDLERLWPTVSDRSHAPTDMEGEVMQCCAHRSHTPETIRVFKCSSISPAVKQEVKPFLSPDFVQ